MGSTAGTGRLTNIVKNMIALPPYQKSVLIGILLSVARRAPVIYLQLNHMKILI